MTGTHNFTVPAKLMGSVFVSEGAAFAGVNSEDSSRNHSHSMSSCRQADQIGIGAAVSCRPLAPHRAYESIQGGSRNTSIAFET